MLLPAYRYCRVVTELYDRKVPSRLRQAHLATLDVPDVPMSVALPEPLRGYSHMLRPRPPRQLPRKVISPQVGVSEQHPRVLMPRNNGQLRDRQAKLTEA